MDRYPIPAPAVLGKIIRKERPSAPLTAMFHITEHCNVRCEFCWHHSFLKTDHHRPQLMETSAVIDMINDLAQMGTTDITLSANGEPTLHPGFPSMVEAVKKAGMKLKVVTNLTLFSPTVAAALARTDLLVINFAATDDAIYQSIYAPRGAVSFEQITKNIRALAKLQKHGGPEIRLGYVITKNTFRNIEKFLHVAEACQAASIRFKFIDPLSFTQSLVLGDHDRQLLAEDIARILKQPVRVASNLRDILLSLSSSGTKKSASPDGEEHARCFIGWLVMNINENGSVTLCCQNDHLVIGNWKEKPLEEIWQGEKAQEFRHTAKRRIDFDNPLWHACRGCHYSNPKHYLRRVNQL